MRKDLNLTIKSSKLKRKKEGSQIHTFSLDKRKKNIYNLNTNVWVVAKLILVAWNFPFFEWFLCIYVSWFLNSSSLLETCNWITFLFSPFLEHHCMFTHLNTFVAMHGPFIAPWTQGDWYKLNKFCPILYHFPSYLSFHGEKNNNKYKRKKIYDVDGHNGY